MASEAELVERARRGDENAWTGLVEAHQDAIFRLAYLLLGDADDAEDVAQETLIRAYRALDRFDPACSLRPWLLAIVVNLSANWRRAIGRRFAAFQRFLRGEWPRGEPDQTAEKKLETQWVWDAVRRLSLPERQMIYLRYYLECSEAEMATALAIAPGTVKSRLSRAVAKLRDVMRNEYAAGRGFHEEEWLDA